jgi:hypothetical protein
VHVISYCEISLPGMPNWIWIRRREQGVQIASLPLFLKKLKRQSSCGLFPEYLDLSKAVTEQYPTKIRIKEEEDVLCTIIPNGSESEDIREEPACRRFPPAAAHCASAIYCCALSSVYYRGNWFSWEDTIDYNVVDQNLGSNTTMHAIVSSTNINQQCRRI